MSKYLSDASIEATLRTVLGQRHLSSSELQYEDLPEVVAEAMLGLRLFCNPELLPELMVDLADYCDQKPS